MWQWHVGRAGFGDKPPLYFSSELTEMGAQGRVRRKFQCVSSKASLHDGGDPEKHWSYPVDEYLSSRASGSSRYSVCCA